MSGVWVIGIMEDEVVTGTSIHEEDCGVERIYKSHSKRVSIEVLLDIERPWRLWPRVFRYRLGRDGAT